MQHQTQPQSTEEVDTITLLWKPAAVYVHQWIISSLLTTALIHLRNQHVLFVWVLFIYGTELLFFNPFLTVLCNFYINNWLTWGTSQKTRRMTGCFCACDIKHNFQHWINTKWGVLRLIKLNLLAEIPIWMWK